MAELRDLLGVLRDGELSEEQTSRLDQLLAGDPEAQQFYAEYIDLCVTLRHYHGAPVGENATAGNVPCETPSKPRIRRRLRRWAGPVLIAATLLVGFGFGLWSGLWIGARPVATATD